MVRKFFAPLREMHKRMRYENFEVRTDVKWLAPVWIRIGTGAPEQVQTASAALEKLTYRWPHQRGRHYLSAKTCCLAALNGQMPADMAREAFIHAAIEAQMLD
jgi:hypothetical protein